MLLTEDDLTLIVMGHVEQAFDGMSWEMGQVFFAFDKRGLVTAEVSMTPMTFDVDEETDKGVH